MLLARRQTHLRGEHLGMRLHFADGTTGRVYRETTVDHATVDEPCVLVVEFRLRGIRGWGHRLFRWESILNTPLFVGFPGLVSKLWLAHDGNGAYRGFYEWDGRKRAHFYARCLWRVLALVSVPGSIHYVVCPGLHRDEVLEAPDRLGADVADRDAAWWRLVSVDRPVRSRDRGGLNADVQ
jgi:hypothetical protein